MRLLIVEDQELTLEALEFVASRVFPQFYPSFSRENYDVAKWYTQAQDMITRNQPYDLVFLDNRMPYDDPGCTDESDFDRFSSHLRNIGYGLIGQIKQKNRETVVIGTSSMNEDELRGIPKPDYKINKSGDEEKELTSVIRKIINGTEPENVPEMHKQLQVIIPQEQNPQKPQLTLGWILGV